MEAMAKQQTIISAVKDYSRQLFGFIRSRVNSNEDAEDILQDVWYQFSNFSGVDSVENVGGWLYRVARNRIIDKSRKKKEAHLDGMIYEDDESVSFFSSLLRSHDVDAETQTMQRVIWDELMTALQELPEKQRNVFIWNELEDMTLQEIADRENENIKTIISRKRYAVLHLRERLETLYNDLTNN